MKRILALLIPFCLVAQEECSFDTLCRDLEIVRCYNPCRCYFPTTYNFFAQGGLLMMPSARMGEAGELGFAFSSIPPYYNYSGRAQVYSHLEITGSYRVFRGVDDPLLSEFGFGDFSDKGINAKFAIFRPEDSNYNLPGFAVGWDDFLGTKAFEAVYVALTQVVRPLNLELTAGWGWKRIHGFYGGATWSPFYSWCHPLLAGLSLTAEWDATDYNEDPHPRGRNYSSRVNLGAKYRFYDYIDLIIAQVRGNRLAMGAQISYNFGTTNGFLPKVNDPLPYRAPVNYEPIGEWRPYSLFVSEMYGAFCDQGLKLLDIHIYHDSCEQRVLRVLFYNDTYRSEWDVRERLMHLLGSLLPCDIDEVVAVQYSEGFSIQEWNFYGNYLRQYLDQEIGDYEMATVTPLREVTQLDSCCPTQLYSERLKVFDYYLLPRSHFYFGSSRGKFKYAAGLTAIGDGYLTQWDVFWRVKLGYLLFSDLEDVSDVDMLNPSQLINVHTQIIAYEKQRGLRLDEFYLQKNLAIGCGWYARGALGYFDIMYSGAAAEALWYPVNSPFAAGVNGALLFRRTLKGLGFSDKIRKLNGFTPEFVPFTGTQFFLNLYYDWRDAQTTFKVSSGKFLANDWGSRLEVARYFPSGLRLFLWYTWTNGNDRVNGHTYFDKGVGFSMPLDIFFTCSSKERFGYAINAWLRDVGYEAPTGRPLYDMIYYERQ